MKFTRKFAAAGAVLAMLLSACSSTSSPSASAGAGGGGSAAGCTIGMSWNNYQEERWAKWDEPAIKSTIEAAGGKYIANDAKSSAETQATNVENLISQGAKVLLILAQDDKAIKPSVAAAISRGIPVVSYDRLIEDPGVFYVTFDNVEVGRMQAREIFKLVPKGNYVFIKGNKAVDVWKDARELGKAAATAAIQLCSNKDVTKVSGGSSFTTPGGNKVASILLKPQPITKANLQVVLDAKWIAKDKLCQGVTAGSVPGC